MRYVAPYLLASLGAIVGMEADDDPLNKVISELNRRLASLPAGGAVAVPALPECAAPAKRQGVVRESVDDMRFDLFH
ncbi:unnamed protein product [Nyctereutes procyonoides]|uniref:(raccoon dog) hypothetical protein n=1 Tax=Nyctereutes procyonoides TaxID=34880 RepID=A0A811ZJT1_NYCPR|nr:unnamed protein product [Nyctereutes procyonoides]